MKHCSASKALNETTVVTHEMHLLLNTKKLVPVVLSQGFLPFSPRDYTPRRHPGLAFDQNVASLSSQSLGLQHVLGEVWSNG